MHFTTDQYLEIYNYMNSNQSDAPTSIVNDQNYQKAYHFAQSMDFHQWRNIMQGDLEDIPAIQLQTKDLEAL